MEEEKQKEVEESQEEIESEWDNDVQQGNEPVLLSDFEHKAFLVTPARSKVHSITPEDILDKDFSLSILDQDQGFIYGIKATAAEEWNALGFVMLSRRRKAHLKIKLGLN